MSSLKMSILKKFKHMDNGTRAIVLSILITASVITLGYYRKTPLTFFEFIFIDIFVYFSYRILFVLQDLRSEMK